MSEQVKVVLKNGLWMRYRVDEEQGVIEDKDVYKLMDEQGDILAIYPKEVVERVIRETGFALYN